MTERQKIAECDYLYYRKIQEVLFTNKKFKKLFSKLKFKLKNSLKTKLTSLRLPYGNRTKSKTITSVT